MKKLIDCTFDATIEFLSQEARIFRYSLSYCFMLALFPMVIIVFTMFYTGFFDISKIIDINYVMGALDSFGLSEFLNPLITNIQERPYTNITSSIITILISCFMASNSMYSFMLITAQQEDFRTYGLLIRIKALFMFVVLLLAVLGIAMLAYFLPIQIQTIGIISVFVFLYLFFRELSFAKRPIWYGLPGTIFSGLAIVIVSALFVTVIHFIDYGSIYGPLAGVVGALLVVNIISSIIYFGYCLNQAYSKDIEIEKYKTMWFYAYGEIFIGNIESRIIAKTNKNVMKNTKDNDGTTSSKKKDISEM